MKGHADQQFAPHPPSQEYTSLTAAVIFLVAASILYYCVVFVADLLVVCAPDVAYSVSQWGGRTGDRRTQLAPPLLSPRSVR